MVELFRAQHGTLRHPSLRIHIRIASTERIFNESVQQPRASDWPEQGRLSLVISCMCCLLPLPQEIDLGMLASETDDKIEQLRLGWFSILEKTDTDDPQNRFRIGLLKLGYSYARLVALSFGFQHAFGKSNTDENPFLNRVRHCFILIRSFRPLSLGL